MLLPFREGGVLVDGERDGLETRKGSGAVALLAKDTHVLERERISGTYINGRYRNLTNAVERPSMPRPMIPL